MDAREVIRGQFGMAHNVLNMVLGDCTDATVNAVPPGSINSIGAIYAHLVLGEDWIVQQMAQEKPSIFASGNWAERTGVPGDSARQTPEWASNIKLNLGEFNAYAKEVFAATDAAVASLTEEQFARQVNGPLGPTSVLNLIAGLGVFLTSQHLGEIAALKGVQGLKGLPF